MTATGQTPAPRQERKLVTALFVDLSGYTALCRALDPESVVAAVAPVMAVLRAAAERQGGLVQSVEGDGFLAVFGVPTAHDDDPQRALGAAIDMRAALHDGAWDVPDLHIGLATGEVLVSRDTTGWSWAGMAVNLASRLCDLASAGEILADQSCVRLARGSFLLGAQRSVAVQGVRDPETVWPVLGRVAQAADPPATSLVGRGEVLQWLSDHLAQVRVAGTGRVVAVRGEPGVGKSAAVRAWSDEQRLSGAADVLWGQVSAIGSSDRPLSALLDAIAGLPAGHVLSTEVVVKELANRLAERGCADAELLAGRLVRASTDAFVGRDLVVRSAAVAALEALAALEGRPQVVVLEDCHGAPGDLLGLLAAVDTGAVAAPVLLVVTCRSGSASEVQELGSDSFELSGLSLAQTQELIASAVAGGAELSSARVGEVHRRSGGNPLFALELANLLSSEGGSAAGQLPESVRLVLAARLDTLSPEAKALTQAASVMGEAGALSELAALVELSRAEVAERVDLARGLLRREGDRWSFAHALVRDAAYASLPRVERAGMHRQLMGSTTSLAARTWHAVRALEHDVTADPTARRRSASAAVGALNEHVRALYAREARAAYEVSCAHADVVDEALLADPATASQLLATSARAALELGLLAEAEQLSSRAVPAAAASGDEALVATAQLARGHALSRRGEVDAARAHAVAAREVGLRLRDRGLVGAALLLEGESWRYESLPRFADLLEQAHDDLVVAGSVAGAAEAARTLAYLLSTAGGPSFDRWLGEAQRLTAEDDWRGQAWIARAASFAALARGEADLALAEAHRALVIGERCGASDVVADAVVLQLEAAGLIGRRDVWQEARRRAAELAPSGRLALAVTAASVLGWLSFGEVTQARTEVAAALAGLDGFGDGERATVLTAAAEVARADGDFKRAESLFAKAAQAAAAAGLELSRMGAELGALLAQAACGVAPGEDAIRLRGAMVDAGASGLVRRFDAALRSG